MESSCGLIKYNLGPTAPKEIRAMAKEANGSYSI